MTEGVIVALIGAGQAITLALFAWLGSRVGKIKKDAASAAADAATAAHEAKPNSGSTMADAIIRIEKRLTADFHRIAGVEKRLEDHIQQSETIIRLLTKKES